MKVIAIEVLDHRALGGLHEATHAQTTAQVRAVLERHAISRSELQIGHRLARARSHLRTHGKPGSKVTAQRIEPGLSQCDDLGRCAIGIKKTLGVVRITRNARCQQLGDAHMASQRSVLGARQRQSMARTVGQISQRGGGGHGGQHGVLHTELLEDITRVYRPELTAR